MITQDQLAVNVHLDKFIFASNGHIMPDACSRRVILQQSRDRASRLLLRKIDAAVPQIDNIAPIRGEAEIDRERRATFLSDITLQGIIRPRVASRNPGRAGPLGAQVVDIAILVDHPIAIHLPTVQLAILKIIGKENQARLRGRTGWRGLLIALLACKRKQTQHQYHDNGFFFLHLTPPINTCQDTINAKQSALKSKTVRPQR